MKAIRPVMTITAELASTVAMKVNRVTVPVARATVWIDDAEVAGIAVTISHGDVAVIVIVEGIGTSGSHGNGV